MFLVDEAVPDLDTGALIFDYFAGAGGASEGIRMALGRGPDVAVNHSELALEIHALNHPETDHFCADVWRVGSRKHLPPGRIALAWYSPDCTDHSRAKGGKPASNARRGLAWVVVDVERERRPPVNVTENVPEFVKWGELDEEGQPIPEKEGDTFRAWIKAQQDLGYVVEWRVLNAADYGAPTSRRRLFVIARCDGKPIVWPEPTHGPGRAKPWVTAAEIIDWSLPMLSIFATPAEARAFAKLHGLDGTPKRPLAEATMRRIFEGLKRFVFGSRRPFLVQINHGGDKNRSQTLEQPLPTITSHHGFAIIAPTLVQTGYGEREGQAPRALDLEKPLGTVVACGVKHGIAAAFLQKHNGKTIGQPLNLPVSTLVTTNNKSVVAAFLTKYYGDAGGRVRAGQGLEEPLGTQTTANRFALAAAFLSKYNGTGVGQALGDPLGTVTTHDRFALALATIDGETYALVDILFRMLEPHELARAQGFPDSYKLLGSKAERVEKIGNSVCPQVAEAIVRANVTITTTAPRRPSRARVSEAAE